MVAGGPLPTGRIFSVEKLYSRQSVMSSDSCELHHNVDACRHLPGGGPELAAPAGI
jgi:hypothetical protein